MASTAKKKIQPKDSNETPQLFTVVSGLGQELDAPLRSMVLRTQQLIDDYGKKDFEYLSYKDFKSIIQTLQQINRQLKHCHATTEQMINLNKRKANINNQSCQANDVIKDVVAIFRQQLEVSKIKIQLRLAPHLPIARIGQVECHQIINNIVVNAFQSMPAGGVIKIKTTLDAASKFVFIDIEDEGIGIASEHLTRVFEPFFTTKERGIEKSSGLSLSIVYAIINAFGGSIDIKSSLRKGTLVHIALPIAH